MQNNQYLYSKNLKWIKAIVCEEFRLIRWNVITWSKRGRLQCWSRCKIYSLMGMNTCSLMINVWVVQNAANRSGEMSTAVSFQCWEIPRRVYHLSHAESTTNDPAIVNTRTCSITSSFPISLTSSYIRPSSGFFLSFFLFGFCWVLSSHPQPYVNVSFQVLLFVDDPLVRWSPMRVVSCLFDPSDALNTVAVNNLRTNDDIPLPPPPLPPPILLPPPSLVCKLKGNNTWQTLASNDVNLPSAIFCTFLFFFFQSCFYHCWCVYVFSFVICSALIHL